MIDGDYGFIGNKIDNSSYSAINSGVKNRIFRAGDSSFINNVECSIIIDGDGDTIRTGADYSFAFGNRVRVTQDHVAAFFTDSVGWKRGKLSINDPNPHSNLQCNGSFALPIVETDTTYYVGENDYAVVVTDQDSPTTYVFLPPSVGIKGRIYVIKNYSGDRISIIPDTSVGDCIDEYCIVKYLDDGQSIMLQSNGSNKWYIIAHRN